MAHPTIPSRPTRARLLVGLAVAVGLVSTACGAAIAPVTTSPAAATPPPAARPVAAVAADQGALDGRSVAITGFFTTDGSVHKVCDAILESYPPQCGGATIHVRGTIPQPVLAALESTRNEPTLAQVAWGNVEVRGVLHAAAGDRPASLDLVEMRVVDR